MGANIESFIVAVVLAIVLLAAGHLSLEKTIGRRRALSAAAGGSLAYIFVNLLPEIETSKEVFRQTSHNFMPYEGLFGVNIAMLLGYLCFYALSEMMPEKIEDKKSAKYDQGFWAQILGYGGYICLVGYLLVHSLAEVQESLLLYAVSMSFHFLLVGFGLRDLHPVNYDRIGRFVLAGFCLAGWFVGTMIEMPLPLVIILFGFVSGGVLAVTGIVELPKGKEGRFAFFILGAAVYAIFLITFR